MNSSSFRINPALDPEELSRAFAMRSRLHIPSFLEPECAGNLLEYLKGDPGWKLVVNSEDKLFELDRPTQASLTAEQQRQLDEAVHAKARYGFQYRYETLRVPDAESERIARGTILDDFALFLSSDATLAFLQTVIGGSGLAFADAQATAYGPGHFLTAHDDAVAGKNRQAAFVMNLSADWSADWGGMLAFHEPGNAIAEAFIPTFNSLNLFGAPQRHSVTMVAPFPPRRRYSVTGWLRPGPKP